MVVPICENEIWVLAVNSIWPQNAIFAVSFVLFGLNRPNEQGVTLILDYFIMLESKLYFFSQSVCSHLFYHLIYACAVLVSAGFLKEILEQKHVNFLTQVMF